MPCNCYHCHQYLPHPRFDHWVVPGIRAGVVCDHCGRHFEVWKGELWFVKETKKQIIINKVNLNILIISY